MRWKKRKNKSTYQQADKNGTNFFIVAAAGYPA